MSIVISVTTGVDAGSLPVTNTGKISAGTGLPVILNTAGVDRVTVDTAGNVGIGVTPSAWNNGANVKVLDTVAGSIDSVGYTLLGVTQNAYYNSAGNWIYKNNGQATRYAQGDIHSWYTAPSGTAGNAITWTNAMTLDSAGNLGIGTNSSYGKLQVKTSESGLEVNPNYTNIFGTTLTTRLLAYDRTNSVRRPIELDGSVISLVNAGGNISLANTGNILVGTSIDNGIDKLQINGSFISTRSSGSYVGKTLSIFTFNDNLSHSITSGLPNGLGNQSFIVEISSASGICSFPVYCFGGSNVAYRFNYLNPSNGVWVNTGGSNLSMSFTEQGSSPNTYAFFISAGNGHATIQATTKNSQYSICITTI